MAAGSRRLPAVRGDWSWLLGVAAVLLMLLVIGWAWYGLRAHRLGHAATAAPASGTVPASVSGAGGMAPIPAAGSAAAAPAGAAAAPAPVPTVLASVPSEPGAFVSSSSNWLAAPKLQADFVPTPKQFERDKAAQPQGPWRSAYWNFKSLGAWPVLSGEAVAVCVNAKLLAPGSAGPNDASRLKVLKLAGNPTEGLRLQRFTYADQTKGYGEQEVPGSFVELWAESHALTFSTPLAAGYYVILTDTGAYFFEVQ